MFAFLISAAVVTALPDAQLTTLDGKTISGRVLDITPENVRMHTKDGEQAIPSSQVLRVTDGKTAVAQPATQLVELVDGSQLAAREYSVDGAVASIMLNGRILYSIPIKQVRLVRFGTIADLSEWNQIVKEHAASDLLVLRKGAALDYLEGILHDVNANTVRFETDGRTIPVKRAKVAGIVYYHGVKQHPPDPFCMLTDRDGSQFAVRKIALKDGKLNIETGSGITNELSLEAVSALDFSAGKQRYLSDLEPAAVEYTPYFGGESEGSETQQINSPARDKSLTGGNLELDGNKYVKGVALHSRTKAMYQLPRGFRRFAATVGIDDAVRPHGEAIVRIQGDGKPLWERAVRGTESASNVDIDIAGVRMLEVQADFGANLDIADHVDLCDARLTK